MIAAALMKPMMTGWEMKLTITPSLNAPIAIWIRPTRSASSSASTTYWSVPAIASGASAEAVMSEITATGPVRSWRDEPQSAPTMAGMNAAYRPK